MSESQANFIHEPSESEIQARARELNLNLLLPHVRATVDPLAPVTHGLEFVEDHMREPGLHPAPSEVALDAIRRVGEQLRAESEGSTSATQDLPPSENR